MYCISSSIMYLKSAQSTRPDPQFRSVTSICSISSSPSQIPVISATRCRSFAPMKPFRSKSQSEKSHSLTPRSPTLAISKISTNRLYLIQWSHLSISALMILRSYCSEVIMVARLSTLLVITPRPSLSSCSKVDCRQEMGGSTREQAEEVRSERCRECACSLGSSSEWWESSRKVSAGGRDSSVKWSKSQEDSVSDITNNNRIALMRAISKFMLKYLLMTLVLVLAGLVFNLNAIASEVPEQDSPQDCRSLYQYTHDYRQCTDRLGLCTQLREECVDERRVEECLFGWERTHIFFGSRYCVTSERSRYNQKGLTELKWPIALLASVLSLALWLRHVRSAYLRFRKAKM